MHVPTFYILDASLEQAKKDSDIDCPEAEALKRNMDNLISRLSGSLVSVASAAYSARLLAPNEKDIADPSAGKQHIYAVELLDEVGNRIKKKPKTFDEFVIILKDLGGILTDISDEMSKLYVQNHANTQDIGLIVIIARIGHYMHNYSSAC